MATPSDQAHGGAEDRQERLERGVQRLSLELGAKFLPGESGRAAEEKLRALTDAMMEEKVTASDPSIWRIVEKDVLLRQLDHHWKEHLATLDALRAGRQAR